jgi:hypothetical protein
MDQNQQKITPYFYGHFSKFENINEPIMDKELTTQERIEIFKTLAYNFFDDNTFFLSYFLSIHKIPPFDFVCAQYGFINCRNVEEKRHLIMIYKTVLEKCYPDLFVFKPLQLLYYAFCQDKIADFIIESYGRIRFTDPHFYWFLQNQNIVKHNVDYQIHMERKRLLFVNQNNK